MTKLTSNSKPILSIGILYFLAKFCVAPVKKECTNEKPDIQKVDGFPFLSHFERKLSRSRKSFI